MTIEEANKLLDAVKDGQNTRPSAIAEALFTTGDLQEITPTFNLDGWTERRKTIRLARSATT
jgi:hypothetical protein